MAWVGADLASTRLITATKTDYALVARAISEFEPVLMVARPGFGGEAAAYCGSGVEVVELPLGEAWLRDSGPIFARNGRAGLIAVDFLFNGWGTTLPADDARRESRERAWRSGSGSSAWPSRSCWKEAAVTTDGEGTLIAVETTILHERRNPGDVARRLRGRVPRVPRHRAHDLARARPARGSHRRPRRQRCGVRRPRARPLPDRQGPRRSEPRPAGGEPRRARGGRSRGRSSSTSSPTASGPDAGWRCRT